MICIVLVLVCAAPAFAQEAELADDTDAVTVQEETQQDAEAAEGAELAENTGEEPGQEPGEEPQEPAWKPGDPVTAPVNLTVTVLNGSQLLLQWDGDPALTGYEVQYARNILFIFASKMTVEAQEANALTLNGLQTSKRYYVRVRAFGEADGERCDSEWIRVSTSKDSAVANIRFAKKDGKKVDVRKQAKKKLKHYDIAQGCCSDGKYLYMAFERRNGDENGNRKARIKIAKVRISDWKLVKVSSKGQKLGHANDLTYNPYKNCLVVTGAKKKDPYVRIVSANTLKKTATKKVKLGTAYRGVKAFNEIDFDPVSRTYLIRSRNYGGLTFTLNENFSRIDAKRITTTWGSRHVQSCTTTGGCLILTQSLNQSSGKNTLTIFDSAGKKLQDIKIKMKGELESVFMIGEKLFATMHKKMKGYKTAYIFEVLL